MHLRKYQFYDKRFPGFDKYFIFEVSVVSDVNSPSLKFHARFPFIQLLAW